MLPALDRLPEVKQLVEDEEYFVIHAPRQTGKTTALQALAREINAKGEMVALYCTLETLQGATDPEKANAAIAGLLVDNYESTLADVCASPFIRESTPEYDSRVIVVRSALRSLCRRAGKPLVVFFDEADCLFGQVLISFLRQLRDGYVNRGMVPFPASIALVGMLDVRDYKAQIRPDGESLGQISPFNIITEDISLRNFNESEIAALYSQHTDETGQPFEADVAAKVWELTRGQPWLVNALARECVEKIHGRRYGEPITAEDVETAKETIIRQQGTHIDSLMERLREPRVRRVVEPVILGEDRQVSITDEDHRYVTDLGLLREEKGALVPSNRMYAEIIGRQLTRDQQSRMQLSVPDVPWATPDGLDMAGLMSAFQSFWRENSGADHDMCGYKEATPHLMLMAFLQRVVNGGGRITREMAAGSKRLDLCVEFRGHRYAVEVKLRKRFNSDSYSQLAGYLGTLGLAEGWLAVFDTDSDKSWNEKLYNRNETFAGKTIHVVGL